MFTGIIKQIGTVKKIVSLNKGIDVVISCNTNDLQCELGDSMNVNGVCSTVTTFNDHEFTVQYLEETLDKTTFDSMKIGDKLNLEPSLTLKAKLSGHFVSGHVDGVGSIEKMHLNDPWGLLKVNFDSNLAPYFIYKGSICVDGISLTIAEIQNNSFICYIIPHTFTETILNYKKSGDRVNLECDFIGKYVLRNIEMGNLSLNDK
jgi:riboflavin synthase